MPKIESGQGLPLWIFQSRKRLLDIIRCLLYGFGFHRKLFNLNNELLSIIFKVQFIDLKLGWKSTAAFIGI